MPTRKEEAAMIRDPISPADREALIAQAISAAHCWFFVCACAALAVLAAILLSL
jgi:hypothetical protein